MENPMTLRIRNNDWRRKQKARREKKKVRRSKMETLNYWRRILLKIEELLLKNIINLGENIKQYDSLMSEKLQNRAESDKIVARMNVHRTMIDVLQEQQRVALANLQSAEYELKLEW